MDSYERLPSAELDPKKPIGAAFCRKDVGEFNAAARYLWQLPYGRTRDRADFMGVLAEGRGTCSTKHALLAALALENGLAVELTLGIYQMQESNTPGVGQVLARHGLPYIPEAHCYLAYGSERIDITRSGTGAGDPITGFMHEEVIAPAQIGDYKVQLHQRWIEDWLVTDQGGAGRWSFHEVWSVREACIEALAQ